MTPDHLAHIHACAFVQDRGWSSAEFADLLAQPHTELFTAAAPGFALTRTLAGESELLTLAIHPDHQRRGLAQGLMQTWLATACNRADTAFLEVAADNSPAIRLYSQMGFTHSGTRKAYYARPDRPAVDALLMTRALTRG